MHRRRIVVVAIAILLGCATARPTAESPFQQTDNHVFLPVAIGRHAPSWFLLDTGAQFTAVAQTAADALGLVAGERGRARGAGPGVVETALFRDVDVGVAGLPLHLPRLIGLPLTELSLAEGRAIDGAVGYDVINDYAVEIDYARHVVRFHDPSTYIAPPDAMAVPLTFDRDHPVIAATLTLRDGRTLPLRLMVDTGAGGAILVNRPFAERHAIYDALAPAIEGPFGVGLGGPSQQRMGRAARVAIAGFTFDAPLVSASLDRAGAAALTEIDGIAGGELLRRFTTTFDYRHNRLLLTPNAALRAPFEADMSGARFKAADLKFDRILVRHVLPHSPAAEAGLEIGDELVAVDSRPAATLTIAGLHELFSQPGRRFTLRVGRGGREFEVTLTTRRLV